MASGSRSLHASTVPLDLGTIQLRREPSRPWLDAIALRAAPHHLTGDRRQPNDTAASAAGCNQPIESGIPIQTDTCKLNSVVAQPGLPKRATPLLTAISKPDQLSAALELLRQGAIRTPLTTRFL